MKKLAIPAIIALCMIGCSSNIKVPKGTSVTYEDRLAGAKVVVGSPLAGEIIDRLNDDPDDAEKKAGMPLDTQKYLHVGAMTLQVMADELVLIDDWGVRTWEFKGIETRLADLLPKN